jgi:hypothetical protein
MPLNELAYGGKFSLFPSPIKTEVDFAIYNQVTIHPNKKGITPIYSPFPLPTLLLTTRNSTVNAGNRVMELARIMGKSFSIMP